MSHLSASPEATRPTVAPSHFSPAPRGDASLPGYAVVDASPLPKCPSVGDLNHDPSAMRSVSVIAPLRDVSPSPQHLPLYEHESDATDFGCQTVVEPQHGVWGTGRSDTDSASRRSGAPSMAHVSRCSAPCETSLLGQTCLARRSSTNSILRCGESLVELQLESGAFSSRSQEAGAGPSGLPHRSADLHQRQERSCSRVPLAESLTDGQLPMDLSCVSWGGHSLTTPVGTVSPIDSAVAAGRGGNACGNQTLTKPDVGAGRASRSPGPTKPAMTTRGNYQLTSRTAGRLNLTSHQAYKSKSIGGPQHGEHSVSRSPAPRNPTSPPQGFTVPDTVNSVDAGVEGRRGDSDMASSEDAVRRSVALSRNDDSVFTSSISGGSRGDSLRPADREPRHTEGLRVETASTNTQRPAAPGTTPPSEAVRPRAGLSLRPQAMINEAGRGTGPKARSGGNKDGVTDERLQYPERVQSST